MKYTSNPDLIVNNHGKIIIEMSKTLSVVPINRVQFGTLKGSGGLTYRQGSQWKSQLDWALCSTDALHLIKNFNIEHNLSLPSNHAPVVIEIEANSVTSFLCYSEQD